MPDTPTDTSENEKAMDVKKPGTAKPDPTGRPIVVTNRSVMKDPMVTDSDGAEKETSDQEAEQNPTTTGKKVIQPLSPKPNSGAETNTTKSETSQASETPTAQPAAPEQKETATSPPADTPQEDDEADDTAIVNAVVDSANQKKTQKQTDDLADQKRKQNAQVLVESKKYNVPIGQVTKARQNRQTVFLAMFILVLGVAYLMIDSGMVDVPFELPYKIFNNS